MKELLAKFYRQIKSEKFKHILIIYILFNLGVLFTLYGSILYSPALVPDAEDLTPEGARMEIINLTKGAFISQNYEINQYNIGYDMLNVGGIFLMIGSLFYNYVETSTSITKKIVKKPRFKIYKLHKKGVLQGNIVEWLGLILFFFAFFTFLNNIFVYIVILSFIVGVIGFTIRKLHRSDLFSDHRTGSNH